MKFVYRKGECNEVADCVSRRSLAAGLAKVTKQVGAHSAINTVSQEQKLARVISQPEAREQVEQHHAEFKQLAPQCNGGVRLFEVTLHHAVVRPEEEEVDIGETEKDNDQFSECPPPAMRGARLSAPCAGSVNP